MSSGASRRCPEVVRRARASTSCSWPEEGRTHRSGSRCSPAAPASRRGDDDPGQAASAGGCQPSWQRQPSGSSALFGVFDLVVARTEPDPDVVRRYAALRPETDRIASTVITLDLPGG